jgi:hypothetical protein
MVEDYRTFRISCCRQIWAEVGGGKILWGSVHLCICSHIKHLIATHPVGTTYLTDDALFLDRHYLWITPQHIPYISCYCCVLQQESYITFHIWCLWPGSFTEWLRLVDILTR